MIKKLSNALVTMGEMAVIALNDYNEYVDLMGGSSLEAKFAFSRAKTIAECVKTLGFVLGYETNRRYFTSLCVTDQEGEPLGLPWELEFEDSLKDYPNYLSYAQIKALQDKEQYYNAVANNTYSGGDF